MNKLLLALVSGWFGISGASSALAECGAGFDIAPAKGLKASLVRAMEACPGPYHVIPNNETEGDTDACSPVEPLHGAGEEQSLFQFTKDGYCTAYMKSRAVIDCSLVLGQNGLPLGLAAGPCHVTFMKVRCSGIRNLEDKPINPVDGLFSLRAVVRATIEGETGGPITTVDLPLLFPFAPSYGGHADMDGTTAEALLALGTERLPECTNLELVSLTMLDPDGLPFAKMGGATTP